MSSIRKLGRRAVYVGALAALAAIVPVAMADTETERSEYVEKVEPICKTNTLANRRIFQGGKNEVKKGELVKASKRFERAATALGKTIEQIEAVPQPPADTAKLTKWIGYLQVEEDLFERIGKALAAGDKGKAENLSVRLKRNSNLANNTVLAFGFNYCRIDPSRFS